jgi:hypothetical protein
VPHGPPTVDGILGGIAQPSPAVTLLPQNFLALQGVLQEFMLSTKSWTIIDSKNELVLYDTNAVAGHPSDLQGVTYNFPDGSTLALVGTPAALVHSHIA